MSPCGRVVWAYPAALRTPNGPKYAALLCSCNLIKTERGLRVETRGDVVLAGCGGGCHGNPHRLPPALIQRQMKRRSPLPTHISLKLTRRWVLSGGENPENIALSRLYILCLFELFCSHIQRTTHTGFSEFTSVLIILHFLVGFSQEAPFLTFR